MTCDEARASFEAPTPALAEHCARCTECAAEFDLHRALAAAFADCAAAGQRVAVRSAAALKPARQRWRTPLIAAAAAAAGFLVARLPQPAAPANIPTANEPAALAGIALAISAVEAQIPGDAWRPAAAGQLLAAGTRLRTPTGGGCEIRLADGTVVRLHEATELALLGPRRLRLENGELFARCATDFTVGTPSGDLAAQAGEFDLRHDAAGARLLVLAGVAAFVQPDGRTVVPPAHAARAAHGRVETPQPVFDPVGATQWIHRLLREQGRDSPELAARIDAWLAQLGRDKLAFLREGEIRALGDHAALPLARYLQSDRARQDSYVARETAARVLADLAQPWSLPDLVALLEHPDGAVRERMAAGAARLSGVPFPAIDWRNDSAARRKEALEEWRRTRDAQAPDRR